MAMKYTQRALILCIIAFISGCTTVGTVKYQPDYSEIQIKEIYQVRVRTGNITLDRLMYTKASHEFGKYLNLASEGPLTGYIDISFTSTAKKLFSASRKGYTTNIAYGKAWYTGDSSFTAEYHPPAPGSEIDQGSHVTWQNSIMNVLIQDSQGNVLWAASYRYRGGTEKSGFHVKTSDYAAAYCLSSIIDRFESDYGIHTSPSGDAKAGVPLIALKVKHRPPVQHSTIPASKKLISRAE
ncbi:MAG: hypothetical protein AMK70_04060 [Nitrospira bacterium SG8_35_1]|nr:MAG: hypothetical protein AMK70_04060 [Nitrospira bacterium SG8_35_1]